MGKTLGETAPRHLLDMVVADPQPLHSGHRSRLPDR